MSNRFRTTALATQLSLVALMAGNGCTPVTVPQSLPSFDVGADVKAEVLVAGAIAPSGLAFSRDRTFYTEKNTGRIRVIASAALLPDSFAEVPVNNAGERGLLGIAVHPAFGQNGRVYVFYSRSDTGQTTSDPRAIIDNRVVYFESAGDVAAGGEVFVASIPPGSGTTRMGGRIRFGSDGKLYVASGDMGDPDAAQSSLSLGGKVLRLNDDGSIPDDNPTPGSAIFASGLRDGVGLELEPGTSIALVLDRNENGNEELNRVGGASNLGWPAVAGTAKSAAQLQFAAENPNYTNPLIDTGTDKPGLVGGGFNTGARYGIDVRGDFFYGESNSRMVVRARIDGGDLVGKVNFAEGFPAGITDVAFTPAGTLYVATQDAIYRLAPAGN